MKNDNRKTNCRAGESEVPVAFRSNRFFTSGTEWFFSTREGVDQGPFPNRISAHDAIQQYIRERQLSS
jgi:hypothetical protein